MKPQHSSIASWKALAGAIAVIAVLGIAGGAQAATPSNQIVVRDQDLNTGVIVLDSVTAAQDGWVVVYKNSDFTNGEIVGYAPVYQGTNKDVRVTINTTKVGTLPTLWAQLHVDGGVKGLFEWGLRNLPYDDPPAVENGHDIVAEFGTWASQAAASAAPAAPVVAAVSNQPVVAPAPGNTKPAGNTGPIVVKNQDLNTGVIVIDSVTAPQAGWVVVYKNPNFTTGEIVGYAPVHQGINQDVKVTINTTKVGDQPTLWVQLHADNGVQGLFEWGLRGLSYDDVPVVENGHSVIAEFGTGATQ